MTSYAFWNNKGGVGKSFLCFVVACEYAHLHPETDVYVVDLCPQGNVTETLLGGFETGAKALRKMQRTSPRQTIAGYLEARLNSPFQMIDRSSDFVTTPHDVNPDIPQNVRLVAGDNLVELLSEAIRQTSQLSVPVNAWAQVMNWLRDLLGALRDLSGDRESVFFVDCNPSFSVYTQIALVACDLLVVPFTGDDSSRRAIENVVALLYGLGGKDVAAYARISFSKRAREERVQVPVLHTFVSNRVTFYEGKASKAFKAVSKTIKDTMDEIFAKRRTMFANTSKLPSKTFIEIPDYHSACIVAAVTGTPLHVLKPGPRVVAGERVQLNAVPLSNYKKALGSLVSRL